MSAYEKKIATWNALQLAINRAVAYLDEPEADLKQIWEHFVWETSSIDLGKFKDYKAATAELIRRNRASTAKILRRLILGCNVPEPVESSKKIPASGRRR